MQSSFFKDPIFRAFAAERPFATMLQMVLRLVLDPNDVDHLFEQHAEEQYHRSLLFSALTRLVSGVVLGKHASMNAGKKNEGATRRLDQCGLCSCYPKAVGWRWKRPSLTNLPRKCGRSRAASTLLAIEKPYAVPRSHRPSERTNESLFTSRQSKSSTNARKTDIESPAYTAYHACREDR